MMNLTRDECLKLLASITFNEDRRGFLSAYDTEEGDAAAITTDDKVKYVIRTIFGRLSTTELVRILERSVGQGISIHCTDISKNMSGKSCPVCYHKTLDGKGFDICVVCYWQDDTTGAGEMSLTNSDASGKPLTMAVARLNFAKTATSSGAPPPPLSQVFRRVFDLAKA
jgi:hypothetical protein